MHFLTLEVNPTRQAFINVIKEESLLTVYRSILLGKRIGTKGICSFCKLCNRLVRLGRLHLHECICGSWLRICVDRLLAAVSSRLCYQTLARLCRVPVRQRILFLLQLLRPHCPDCRHHDPVLFSDLFCCHPHHGASIGTFSSTSEIRVCHFHQQHWLEVKWHGVYSRPGQHELGDELP